MRSVLGPVNSAGHLGAVGYGWRELGVVRVGSYELVRSTGGLVWSCLVLRDPFGRVLV